jgi:UDPglucose 6-dehydrogenase
VRAYDPMLDAGDHPLFPGVVITDEPLQALEGADAAVLVTEWPEFARLDWSAAAAVMKRPLLIDGRNFVDPAAAAAAGLEYEGIGLGDPGPAPAGA